MKGNLFFISQGILCKIDFSGGDPDLHLSEEQLKVLVRDIRIAIEEVLGRHFPNTEIVGERL